MSIMKYFGGKKEKDPDVVAAEKRAYEDELKEVQLRKKNAAIRAAAASGKERARGGSGSSSTSVKVGKKIISTGGSLMKLGRYGASLNWGNEPASQRTQKTTGKKQKKQTAKSKKEYLQQDPYAMPEFPF